MRDFTETNLTAAVIDRLEAATNPRFKQVMTSLIKHLHAFVREVDLTEEEWFAGIQFLTATGQKCDDRRQEFILLSDTLGVSMLVDAINHRKSAGATESTVLGPFYVPGAPEMPSGSNIAEGVEGEPTYFSGRVLTPDGEPIAGAMLDLWSTDGEGWYDVQKPGAPLRARARIGTNSEGCYAFWTIKPVSYPIPTDGPVGKLLLEMGRHPYRPAHTHMIVSAPGHEPVTTHLFVEGDSYLESDAVFAVKNSLVVDFVRHESGIAPDGKRMDRAYYTVQYDFGLLPA
ncbi:MAG TPA: intradiol ring-cleavage dioxygenase [Candidatus Acidoferrales bacterium]|jgi:hydroxyquinol 1,2-dioxygenase|nr:intradiol ring-cleavage dioxygenase [Candidatus Acidoferrales bacterium]